MYCSGEGSRTPSVQSKRRYHKVIVNWYGDLETGVITNTVTLVVVGKSPDSHINGSNLIALQTESNRNMHYIGIQLSYI